MTNCFPQKRPRANVYADHPFTLIKTPVFQLNPETHVNPLLLPSHPTIFHDMASEMALIHNLIFRGLNSIYLQAPHIQSADTLSFVNYMHQWCRAIDIHHRGEEAEFFPAIEKAAGEAGIMDINIEQHKAFTGPLEAFGKYVEACCQHRDVFDGGKVVRMINDFGPALKEHLNAEIGTILGLEKYGQERMAHLVPLFAEESKKAMKSMGLTAGLPFVAVNLDMNYEDGIWREKVPPKEGQRILTVVRNITYWLHRDWWKFGSCDRHGNLQRLYAATDE
ncbi:hemerythrin HHE cation binding domain-containing protein [Stachybotrys elegans]|uniref:Hemerythrin HHE cation binding domain-containing protein n=1 Tax=Stachybotrys elegans TaxID=80388 RepID=A0A8K0WSB3_9HYPO|nr:hemerythrin HHE cation binding domain-containing protein [Stachybotrys elegans]